MQEAANRTDVSDIHSDNSQRQLLTALSQARSWSELPLTTQDQLKQFLGQALRRLNNQQLNTADLHILHSLATLEQGRARADRALLVEFSTLLLATHYNSHGAAALAGIRLARKLEQSGTANRLDVTSETLRNWFIQALDLFSQANTVANQLDVTPTQITELQQRLAQRYRISVGSESDARYLGWTHASYRLHKQIAATRARYAAQYPWLAQADFNLQSLEQLINHAVFKRESPGLIRRDIAVKFGRDEISSSRVQHQLLQLYKLMRLAALQPALQMDLMAWLAEAGFTPDTGGLSSMHSIYLKIANQVTTTNNSIYANYLDWITPLAVYSSYPTLAAQVLGVPPSSAFASVSKLMYQFTPYLAPEALNFLLQPTNAKKIPGTKQAINLRRSYQVMAELTDNAATAPELAMLISLSQQGRDGIFQAGATTELTRSAQRLKLAVLELLTLDTFQVSNADKKKHVHYMQRGVASGLLTNNLLPLRALPAIPIDPDQAVLWGRQRGDVILRVQLSANEQQPATVSGFGQSAADALVQTKQVWLHYSPSTGTVKVFYLGVKPLHRIPDTLQRQGYLIEEYFTQGRAAVFDWNQQDGASTRPDYDLRIDAVGRFVTAVGNEITDEQINTAVLARFSQSPPAGAQVSGLSFQPSVFMLTVTPNNPQQPLTVEQILKNVLPELSRIEYAQMLFSGPVAQWVQPQLEQAVLSGQSPNLDGHYPGPASLRVQSNYHLPGNQSLLAIMGDLSQALAGLPGVHLSSIGPDSAFYYSTGLALPQAEQDPWSFTNTAQQTIATISNDWAAALPMPEHYTLQALRQAVAADLSHLLQQGTIEQPLTNQKALAEILGVSKHLISRIAQRKVTAPRVLTQPAVRKVWLDKIARLYRQAGVAAPAELTNIVEKTAPTVADAVRAVNIVLATPVSVTRAISLTELEKLLSSNRLWLAQKITLTETTDGITVDWKSVPQFPTLMQYTAALQTWYAHYQVVRPSQAVELLQGSGIAIPEPLPAAASTSARVESGLPTTSLGSFLVPVPLLWQNLLNSDQPESGESFRWHIDSPVKIPVSSTPITAGDSEQRSDSPRVTTPESPASEGNLDTREGETSNQDVRGTWRGRQYPELPGWEQTLELFPTPGLLIPGFDSDSAPKLSHTSGGVPKIDIDPTELILGPPLDDPLRELEEALKRAEEQEKIAQWNTPLQELYFGPEQPGFQVGRPEDNPGSIGEQEQQPAAEPVPALASATEEVNALLEQLASRPASAQAGYLRTVAAELYRAGSESLSLEAQGLQQILGNEAGLIAFLQHESINLQALLNAVSDYPQLLHWNNTDNLAIQVRVMALSGNSTYRQNANQFQESVSLILTGYREEQFEQSLAAPSTKPVDLSVAESTTPSLNITTAPPAPPWSAPASPPSGKTTIATTPDHPVAPNSQPSSQSPVPPETSEAKSGFLSGLALAEPEDVPQWWRDAADRLPGPLSDMAHWLGRRGVATLEEMNAATKKDLAALRGEVQDPETREQLRQIREVAPDVATFMMTIFKMLNSSPLGALSTVAREGLFQMIRLVHQRFFPPAPQDVPIVPPLSLHPVPGSIEPVSPPSSEPLLADMQLVADQAVLAPTVESPSLVKDSDVRLVQSPSADMRVA